MFIIAKFVIKVYDSFQISREHKGENGPQTLSGAQKVDVTHVMGDLFDKSVKKELETCKHFTHLSVQ